jgi:fatty acid desaturase
MQRSDGRAIRDTLLWYALIIAFGALGCATWGTWWAVPVFLVYGGLYCGAADSRWHEAGHGTAFKTRWMNDLVYQLACFQVLRRPTVWRWSHARHHTDTLVTGRDPEIAAPRPVSIASLVLSLVALKSGPIELWRALRNAFGYLSDEEKTFIPEMSWPKVALEARAWLAVYALVAAACVFAHSLLPLMLIGLPSLYGAWLYVFFGLTQHAGLPENVLDHRRNSRTVLMNPVFRFLYSNMNYHVEHHMFPMVPYHALPRLHEAIKADCPPPYRRDPAGAVAPGARSRLPCPEVAAAKSVRCASGGRVATHVFPIGEPEWGNGSTSVRSTTSTTRTCAASTTPVGPSRSIATRTRSTRATACARTSRCTCPAAS